MKCYSIDNEIKKDEDDNIQDYLIINKQEELYKLTGNWNCDINSFNDCYNNLINKRA